MTNLNLDRLRAVAGVFISEQSRYDIISLGEFMS